MYLAPPKRRADGPPTVPRGVEESVGLPFTVTICLIVFGSAVLIALFGWVVVRRRRSRDRRLLAHAHIATGIPHQFVYPTTTSTPSQSLPPPQTTHHLQEFYAPSAPPAAATTEPAQQQQPPLQGYFAPPAPPLARTAPRVQALAQESQQVNTDSQSQGWMQRWARFGRRRGANSGAETNQGA